MEIIERRRAPIEAYQLLETLRVEIEQHNIPLQALQDLINRYQKPGLNPEKYGRIVRELGEFPIIVRYNNIAQMISENGYKRVNKTFLEHRNFVTPPSVIGQEKKATIEFLTLTADIRELSAKKFIYHDDILAKIQLVIASQGYRPASFFELLTLGGQYPTIVGKRLIGCLHPQYAFSSHPGIPRLQKEPRKEIMGFSNYAYFCAINGGESRGLIAVLKN